MLRENVAGRSEAVFRLAMDILKEWHKNVGGETAVEQHRETLREAVKAVIDYDNLHELGL